MKRKSRLAAQRLTGHMCTATVAAEARSVVVQVAEIHEINTFNPKQSQFQIKNLFQPACNSLLNKKKKFL